MDADDVGRGGDALAASAGPIVIPRLDLSNLVDGSGPSTTRIAMKEALEGQIGGAGIDVAETSETTTLPEISPPMTGAAEDEEEEEAQGPSTPTSSRAAPIETDTCTICTGNLGENGGTLSLLCGEKKNWRVFFFQNIDKTDGR